MHLNPCGHSCNGCPSYLGTDEQGRTCSGCAKNEGKPWWGTCKLFECVKNRNIQHCGVCEEFPCTLQLAHFDPDNPTGQRNAIVRTGLLAIWARHGEVKALEYEHKLRNL